MTARTRVTVTVRVSYPLTLARGEQGQLGHGVTLSEATPRKVTELQGLGLGLGLARVRVRVS